MILLETEIKQVNEELEDSLKAGYISEDSIGIIKYAINEALTLTDVGCSFSIGFAEYIAKEHYKLVNVIGKIHYWGNEESYKTSEQLLKDYKETLT